MRVFFRGADRIATMTSRARQPERVFAIVEFVERLCRSEAVHRLDVRVAFQTSFEWQR
jgi:hypothetical protein